MATSYIIQAVRCVFTFIMCVLHITEYGDMHIHAMKIHERDRALKWFTHRILRFHEVTIYRVTFSMW